jgi:hypothetical protein
MRLRGKALFQETLFLNLQQFQPNFVQTIYQHIHMFVQIGQVPEQVATPRSIIGHWGQQFGDHLAIFFLTTQLAKIVARIIGFIWKPGVLKFLARNLSRPSFFMSGIGPNGGALSHC